MAYSHKTFRKCGSHYSELGAIEGVEVKVGEKFRPPKKITLPVGFHPKDPSDVLSLSYDFSLETKVIEKAEKEKSLRLQEEEERKASAAAVEAQHEASNTNTAVSQAVPISVFSNVGTDILQPIAVEAAGHKRNDSLGKNTFDLSDFEANGTNPFELVELQTINDLDVLKDVLQPVIPLSSAGTTTINQPAVPSTNHTAGSTVIASAGISTNVTPTSAMGSTAQHGSQHVKRFSYLANQPPKPSTSQASSTRMNSRLSKSVPDICNEQLIDILTGESQMQFAPDVASSNSSDSPPSSQFPPLKQPNSSMSMGYGMPTQPFNYLQGGLPVSSSRQSENNPVLVDIISPSPNPVSHTPLSSSSSPINTTTSSYPTAGQNVKLPMTNYSRNMKLPPLREAPPIPPRPLGRGRNTNNVENINILQGTTVADGIGSLETPSETVKIPVSSSQDATRIPGSYMTHHSETSTPTVNQSLIRRQPAQKRMEKKKRHSTPLPPISPLIPSDTPSIPPLNPPISHPPSKSVLPDPSPVLTESEKNFVKYITVMGFPAPRVARAVQRLGENDTEVVDFLVVIEDICKSGFSGDEAEVALTLNKYEYEKALEFLNLTKTFKELGFQESHIQEALRAADNDRDKALDFLASISA